MERLLTGAVGSPLAAFVLARKVEMALRASAQGEPLTGVVQVRSAPRPLVRHLSECLSLGGRYYAQQQPELNIGEPPIGEQVPPGARVVLCTDVIGTENTVRRAVAMIAGRDADPLVIACVVDARKTPGPVRLLNRTIPVVSLTEVAIGYGSADENVTDIDPLMLRPLPPAPVDLVPGDEVDLLTWFADAPDVLRLGHIDDQPRRHYSAFVRLQAMRQQDGRDRITDAVLSNVRRAFADIRAQGGPDPVTGGPLART